VVKVNNSNNVDDNDDGSNSTMSLPQYSQSKKPHGSNPPHVPPAVLLLSRAYVPTNPSSRLAVVHTNAGSDSHETGWHTPRRDGHEIKQ
jgi:hypothetical protein